MEGARAWVERSLGAPVAEPIPLPGGSGARRYWRVRTREGTSAVLVHAAPEEPHILPPQLRSPPVPIPFVPVTELLARHGIPVPRLLGVELSRRWLLLEDLGDVHVCDLADPERAERLEEAVDLLGRVHAIAPGDELPFRRRFDREWIAFELGHFLEHGVGPHWRGRLEPGFQALAARVAALPATLCLRDYQTQNLMVDAAGRLRVLDYQDALVAPAELDLAALLHDSYVDVSPARRAALLERYGRQRGRGVDPEAFALLVVQRKCKDYGRFRYLVEVKGKGRWGAFREAARASVLGALPALPAELAPLAQALAAALSEPVE
jgi:hypothetical protein